MHISSINTFGNVRTSLDIYGHIFSWCVCVCVSVCESVWPFSKRLMSGESPQSNTEVPLQP